MINNVTNKAVSLSQISFPGRSDWTFNYSKWRLFSYNLTTVTMITFSLKLCVHIFIIIITRAAAASYCQILFRVSQMQSLIKPSWCSGELRFWEARTCPESLQREPRQSDSRPHAYNHHSIENANDEVNNTFLSQSFTWSYECLAYKKIK